MRGWIRAGLFAGVLAGTAACGGQPPLTEPGAAPREDGLAAPAGDGGALHDGSPPPADTTGRWGGGLGSGT